MQEVIRVADMKLFEVIRVAEYAVPSPLSLSLSVFHCICESYGAISFLCIMHHSRLSVQCPRFLCEWVGDLRVVVGFGDFFGCPTL